MELRQGWVLGWGGAYSSVEWGLGLGPAQKGGGSMSRGGSLECGALELGGKALGNGVWVGFRPSMVGGGLRGDL